MGETGQILKLVDLVKQYEPGDNVLQEVNLAVEFGQSLAIVGPSGSGKSTLLNIMGGLDRPTSGAAYFMDKNLSEMQEEELARIRNQEIGFVFQLHHLLPQLTALENVLTPTLVNPGYDGRARALFLLERVGLKERIHYKPGKLSGGERQRVAFVRAMINKPKLILADEPTGSLDRSASMETAKLLKQINQEEGAALVAVTHSMDLAQNMDRVLELRDSQLKPWEPSS